MTWMNHMQTLGRPAKMTMGEIVRELTEADLAELGRDRGVRPPALKRITDTHHSIARLMAQGEAGYAIAAATGYSQSRLSILKADPAFQELVAHYREEVAEVRHEHFVDVNAKMVAGLADTVESMHEDVLEDRLDPRDKIDYAKFFADRTGFGPTTKSDNLNTSISFAERISVGRLKAAELNARIPIAQAARQERLPLTSGEGDKDE